MNTLGFALYLTCLFLGRGARTTDLKSSVNAHKESSFVSANVGDSVTLKCFSEVEGVKFYWYKQTLGQKPRLVSTFYVFAKNGTFYDEFNSDPRFTLDSGNGQNHLSISDLRISDSATYYCTTSSSYNYNFDFSESIVVSVRGSGLNIPAWVHQSASESLQPGSSVTLTCTVHTGSCDGQHSVYWFKTSEEAHPGLIYTHGGRNDQCERKDDTQTHTCVYNLPMESLNDSHAGTYYCAVASCGHILFGDGTKLDFEDETDSLILVYILSGALGFTTILVVLLAFVLYKMNKRNSCRCTESQRVSASTTTNEEGNEDAVNLHYAALRTNTVNRLTKQRADSEWSECVYSAVRQ